MVCLAVCLALSPILFFYSQRQIQVVRLHSERGILTVEMAIILPLLYLLLMGTVEVSNILNAYRIVSEGQQNLELMLEQTSDLASSRYGQALYDSSDTTMPLSHQNAQFEVFRTLMWSDAPIANIRIRSGYDPVKKRVISEVEAVYTSRLTPFLSGIRLKASGEAPYLS